MRRLLHLVFGATWVACSTSVIVAGDTTGAGGAGGSPTTTTTGGGGTEAITVGVGGTTAVGGAGGTSQGGTLAVGGTSAVGGASGGAEPCFCQSTADCIIIDDDCYADPECIDCQCVEAPYPPGAPCGFGFVCDALGNCIPPCGSDADCPPSLTCDNGVCL